MIDQTLMRTDDGFGGFNNVIKVREKEEETLWSPENLEWSMRKEDGLNFTAIQGHTMEMRGQHIYIFGGFFHGRFLNTMYKIDMEESEVYSIVSQGLTPENRAYHQSIAYGNKIIYFGGLNEHQVFNDYLVFNILTKIWYFFIQDQNSNNRRHPFAPRALHAH